MEVKLLLKINQLNMRYPDGNQVLNQLSFHIETGETVGLIGANGAGKSTLLKSIVGIMLPEEGSIEIDKISVTKKSLNKVREKVGVVFQNPEDQLFMSNVYDDIAFGLRNYGMAEDKISERIKGIVKSLGIERLLDHNSNKLSGGEKRLVAIATILVMEPSLVLFDEPTSFLDPRTRRNLIEMLRGFNMTKLIATHDLDMALELCDRVIILSEGTIFKQGNAKELLSNQILMEEAGLELPFCLQKRNNE
ncbi:MAG: cbiO2 [Herbinix sp.]|jgi:cobalt/nickel transport system ATP-binding protein|nr:cbiO2 [Herbinix sp.]